MYGAHKVQQDGVYAVKGCIYEQATLICFICQLEDIEYVFDIITINQVLFQNEILLLIFQTRPKYCNSSGFFRQITLL